MADLDAIAGARPALRLYQELARLGLETWIDAGLHDAEDVKPLVDAGVSRIVVGLETIANGESLPGIVQAAGLSRVVFSLDLRDGRPIVAPAARWGTSDARQIATRAVHAGSTTVIILDLSRVGTGRGVGTADLLRDLVRTHPQVEWVAGGGVAGNADVEALGRAGASAVLVGSAIHDGRITAAACEPPQGTAPMADGSKGARTAARSER